MVYLAASPRWLGGSPGVVWCESDASQLDWGMLGLLFRPCAEGEPTLSPGLKSLSFSPLLTFYTHFSCCSLLYLSVQSLCAQVFALWHLNILVHFVHFITLCVGLSSRLCELYTLPLSHYERKYVQLAVALLIKSLISFSKGWALTVCRWAETWPAFLWHLSNIINIRVMYFRREIEFLKTVLT